MWLKSTPESLKGEAKIFRLLYAIDVPQSSEQENDIRKY